MNRLHTLDTDDADDRWIEHRSRPPQPPEPSATANASLRPGLLRIEEAAEWLGLSRRKTYELLTRGEIQSVYIGRSRRIAFSALQRFVERLSDDRGRSAS
jgi:excisionase family DNA binding protein